MSSTTKPYIADQDLRDIIEAVVGESATNLDLTLITRYDALLRIPVSISGGEMPAFVHAAWHGETIRYVRDKDANWALNSPDRAQLTRVTDLRQSPLRFGVTHMKAYQGKAPVSMVLIDFVSEYIKRAMALGRTFFKEDSTGREALEEKLAGKFSEANRLIYHYLGQHTSDLTDVQLIELCHRIGTDVFAPGRSFIHTVKHDFL